MIKPIIHDILFLGRNCKPASAEDLPVAQDLLDTLKANSSSCVGLAANMIGIDKRIIAFDNNGEPMVMFNPRILKHADPFETEEGCLSLEGLRKTKRYRSIKVEWQIWQNNALQTRIKTFTGWTAQIIQHEIDHCNGVVI